MKTAICRLVSAAPYSQGRFHNLEKKDKESPADYEERTWREKMSHTKTGQIFIPPMAFANCIKQAAQYLSLKIPGSGSEKWTKNFQAGILVSEPLMLPDMINNVESEWLLVPADGKRGGGKRVLKCFPLIKEWNGEVTFIIVDEKITKEVFGYVLKQAGQLIGIGRFRPRNCGYYGRFTVEAIKWQEQ